MTPREVAVHGPGRRQRYSSGTIGRLVPDDVIGLVEYVRDHEPQEQAA
jgi:hypothetical protein